MQTVSILGLGAMGARIASRLLQHDVPVVVYNRTSERAAPLEAQGATVAATPREAAAQSDLVLSIVRDDTAANAVWMADEDGALHGLRPGTVAVESSTVTPAWTRRLAAAVAERDATLLDAPVVGSRPHAEGGRLTFLVGGEADALSQARPVLDLLCGALHHIGPVGTGAATKLAVNALFAVQAAALAEMLAMLRAAGLDPAAAADVLNALPTASPAAARVATLMASEAYAPNFPIHLVAKDLGYAVAEAERTNLDPTVVAATWQAFETATQHGFGEDDIIGIAQLYAD